MSRFTYIFLGVGLTLFGISAFQQVTGGPGLIGLVLKLIDPVYLVKSPFAKNVNLVEPDPPNYDLIGLPVLPQYKNLVFLEVRKLLRNEKYQELNLLLDRLQNEARPNTIERDDLSRAYNGFNIADKKQQNAYDRWVDLFPENYQPYLARGIYYLSRSWLARGTSYASETSDDKMRLMREYLDKAALNLNQALHLNPNSIEAYRIYINVASVYGNRPAVDKIFNSAMRIEPADFKTRNTRLHYLQPRWGGSWKEMEEFVTASLHYSDLNPKMSFLSAAMENELGRVAQRKDPNKAEEIFTHSLRHGDFFQTYYRRADNRYDDGNFQGAISDLTKALELYEGNGDAFYLRSKSYAAIERYDNATFDAIRASQLDPIASKFRTHREWLESKLVHQAYEFNEDAKYDRALKLLNLTELLNPNSRELYYRRGRTLARLNQMELSEADLRKSLSFEPGKIRTYKMLDWVLSRQGRFNEIVEYWDKFIAINPSVPQAYIERGGAYFQMGDLKKAVKSASIAADMGDAMGKSIVREYGPLVQ